MADVRAQLERAVAQFSEELLAVFQAAVAEALSQGAMMQQRRPAAGRRGRPARAVAAPQRRGGRGPRVEAGGLEDKIVDALHNAGGLMTAAELQQRVRAGAPQVRYALGKLKADGRVRQEGERRGAKYAAG